MQGEIPVYGAIYRWSVVDGILTVTAADGRQKHTPVWNSTPRVTARILARQLASQKLQPPNSSAKASAVLPSAKHYRMK
jgi:hypothetical protein